MFTHCYKHFIQIVEPRVFISKQARIERKKQRVKQKSKRKKIKKSKKFETTTKQTHKQRKPLKQIQTTTKTTNQQNPSRTKHIKIIKKPHHQTNTQKANK